MEEVKWEEMAWTDKKGQPSVQIEYACIDGRTQKKFIYNQNTFPNLRKDHAENCDCDYCDPFAPIIPSPPLPGVEDMIVMTIDKMWEAKSKTNELGEEIEYVELAPPTEAELEQFKGHFSGTGVKSIGTKRYAPPFGAKSMPMMEAIDCWEEAQKCFIHQESVAAQKDLEGYVGIASTADYQETNDLKGIVACYVYVGASLTANDNYGWLVEEYKKAWEPILSKIPEDWEVVWVTTKDGDSRIEMLRF